MSAVIAMILPRASVARVAAIDTFVTLALFSGVGLLLSLTVLVVDQYMPANGSDLEPMVPRHDPRSMKKPTLGAVIQRRLSVHDL